MTVTKRKVVVDTHHWMAYNLGATRTYLVLNSIESKISSEVQLPDVYIKAPGSNIPEELEKLKKKYPTSEIILLSTLD